MNPRYVALQSMAKHNSPIAPSQKKSLFSKEFGLHTFNREVMQKMLPSSVYKNVLNAIEGREKIKIEYADAIASAMKDWAVGLGATHYCHWFQPLTGAGAEKHDAFIDWEGPDQVIEKFKGKELLQGEPDASSFPSGGLRSTHEARGYTGWDPITPVFLWSGHNCVTMCIPSVYFSWTGEALDTKIPLLRSNQRINESVMRLLKLLGVKAHHAITTLGCEQEYFVLDRTWSSMRPDLVMSGRTVFGASAAKGQGLQDHYLALVEERIRCYMHDFELAAMKLGIPIKTRHNEVAPSQYEIAPIFERASIAVDHNIILMKLMQQVAVKHNLTCLLHEKPFHGINGSGKHCNWSISTDTGMNLLNPTNTPESNLHFLILVTAILAGVHKHSALLRASIGSAANDHRLGGHEAPPAIISVYLGEKLEKMFLDIEQKGKPTNVVNKTPIDLGIQGIPEMNKDDSDRNRTSPFAFTGNKFEFRAVGASASPALPMTVLNAIVAESLDQMLDEIEANLKGTARDQQALETAVFLVLQKYLGTSLGICFGGDNYSDEWAAEAKKRRLPNVKESIEAMEAIKTEKTIAVFKGILNKQELYSLYDVWGEGYSCIVDIEVNLMLDIFRTQILPVCIEQQKQMAKSIAVTKEILGSKVKLSHQKTSLGKISVGIERAIAAAEEFEKARDQAVKLKNIEKRGKAYCHQVLPKGKVLREIVDQLEQHVDDALWPLPKYREMLYIL